VATIPDSGIYTTAEGLEEKSKLQKHFRRVDMLLFTVCALVGLDTLGQVSGFGASTFSWLVLLAILGPTIRRGYLSARNKMRAATERRRLKR